MSQIFKTQAEIFEALLHGKKIRHKNWYDEMYFVLKNGNLINRLGHTNVLAVFDNPQHWSIYEEPKPKKQVWQWRWFHTVNHKWTVDCDLMNQNEAEKRLGKFKFEKHAGPFEVEE